MPVNLLSLKCSLPRTFAPLVPLAVGPLCWPALLLSFSVREQYCAIDLQPLCPRIAPLCSGGGGLLLCSLCCCHPLLAQPLRLRIAPPSQVVGEVNEGMVTAEAVKHKGSIIFNLIALDTLAKPGAAKQVRSRFRLGGMVCGTAVCGTCCSSGLQCSAFALPVLLRCCF